MIPLRFIALTLALLPITAYASQTPQMPECLVSGKVMSIEIRKEDIPDRGFPRSWWHPKTQKYVDVTIAVSNIETKTPTPFSECSAEDIQVFQLGHDVEKPETEICIRALTNLSGDEFRIGNWIREYEVLEPEQCDGTQHD